MVKCFECSSCNYCEDLNFDTPISKCPECGCGTYRIRYNPKDRKVEVVNIAYGKNLRYSASLGVSETQIEEAKRLHPQVEWKRFGRSFRPLIKNRNDKKKLMKQANYEEYDPKDFKGRDR